MARTPIHYASTTPQAIDFLFWNRALDSSRPSMRAQQSNLRIGAPAVWRWLRYRRASLGRHSSRSGGLNATTPALLGAAPRLTRWNCMHEFAEARR